MTLPATTHARRVHPGGVTTPDRSDFPRFRQRASLLWVALTAFLSASTAAAAEYVVNYANADTRRWSCRLCEFEKAAAQAGTLAAGGLNATGSEMRFGRDNGIDRSGGYLDLNAEYRLATRSGLLVEIAGRNLGLDSRDAALRVRKPGRYGARLRYRETPRNVA
ncbi:MAG: MtrB/PioB family outer membrane beta-barrel protein, partial [Gammaproteobacteria bacterium]|nr:MtrB/PioB family outer membrane beta-barrel protein [Gammaproteobacteria bacterium]